MKSSLVAHLNKKNKCYEYDKIFDIVKSPLEKSKQTDINELTDNLDMSLDKITELETELQEYKDLLDDADFMDKISEMKTELDNVKAELEAKDTEINEIIENRDMVINEYKDKRRNDKAKINELTKIVLKYQEREKQGIPQTKTKITFA
jgi:predicted RNase H-like nuclease (RuvC/YqgF family)